MPKYTYLPTYLPIHQERGTDACHKIKSKSSIFLYWWKVVRSTTDSWMILGSYKLVVSGQFGHKKLHTKIGDIYTLLFAYCWNVVNKG